MNRSPHRRPAQRGARQQKRPAPLDVWRAPDPLPDVEPIAVPVEVGALLRSLGDPPITRGSVAAHYFNAVVERAAAIAVALALSADLLAQPDDDRR